MKKVRYSNVGAATTKDLILKQPFRCLYYLSQADASEIPLYNTDEARIKDSLAVVCIDR